MTSGGGEAIYLEHIVDYKFFFLVYFFEVRCAVIYLEYKLNLQLMQ